MTDLVRERANALDEHAPVGSFTPPTTVGFAVLDAPLREIELRGRTQLGHVLTWGPIATNIGPGWLFSLWNDLSREPDDVFLETTALMGEEHLGLHRGIYGHYDPIGFYGIGKSQLIVPAHLGWTEDQITQSEQEGWEPHVGTNIMRSIVVLWQLMGETVHEPAHVPRPFVRRAEREGILSNVTVVTLRRKDSTPKTGESHEVEWSHRWNVNGHFRDIKDRVTGEVKYRAWIPGHVKGPKDKPLVDKKKVYDLRR